MIPKREAELKSAFSRELRHQLPGFITLLLATAGAPDRAIVGGGYTTYLEFKHGTPTFDSPGNQELMCMRLARQGHCRYVLWQETSQGAHQRTMIVHPDAIHNRVDWKPVPESWCQGFNHQFVVEYLKKIHGLQPRVVQ